MPRAIIFDTENTLEERLHRFEQWHEQGDQSVIYRWRWKEIELATASRIPVFFTAGDSNRPYTTQWEEVTDLSGYECLIRASIGRAQLVYDTVRSTGGAPLVSSEDNTKVDKWLDYVDKEYLKRKVQRVSAGELFGPEEFNEGSHPMVIFGKLFETFRGEMPFIKTEQKSEVRYNPREGGSYSFLRFYSALLANYRPETPLLVSGLIYFKEDKDGIAQEYRHWVLNGKIVASHHHWRNSLVKIPSEVREFAKQFVRHHQGQLPPAYVVDIGVDKEKGPLVVECNGITSAGFGLHCQPITSFLSALSPEANEEAMRKQAGKLQRVEKKKLQVLDIATTPVGDRH